MRTEIETRILYERSGLDREKLQKYCDNVSVILDVIAERRRQGMRLTDDEVKVVLEMVAYDDEGLFVRPLVPQGRYGRELGCCGFNVYDRISVTWATVAILPKGAKFYLRQIAERIFDPTLKVVQNDEVTRTQQIVTEVIRPMIIWLGGSYEAIDKDGSQVGTRVYLPLWPKPHSYANQWLVGLVCRDIEKYMQALNVMAGKFEDYGVLDEDPGSYETCWRRFLGLQGRLPAFTEAEVGIPCSLTFIGDVVLVSFGEADDEQYCVEFSEGGLDKIEEFMGQLR